MFPSLVWWGYPPSLAALPGCLAPFPLVAQSKYLGLPLQLVEDDEPIVDQVCARGLLLHSSPTACSLLLAHRGVPPGLKAWCETLGALLH